MGRETPFALAAAFLAQVMGLIGAMTGDTQQLEMGAGSTSDILVLLSPNSNK